VMPRSILTEKIARRGHHLSREYGVDPLESLLVGQVASQVVETVPARLPLAELEPRYFDSRQSRRHQGYPVVGVDGRLVGVVTRSELMELPRPDELGRLVVASLLARPPVVAHPDETCRTAAERMAREGVGRLPVVAREDPGRLIGILTRSDLLKARERQLEAEQRRERLIELPGGALWEPFRGR
jgi:chloride channel protein, CIC family